MAFYRKRLLPPLLPILAVENQVLLPGTSIVLQVTDLQGYVCRIARGIASFSPNSGSGFCLCFALHSLRMNLVEKYLWNDSSWVEKYVGVVPRDASTDKVCCDFVVKDELVACAFCYSAFRRNFYIPQK